MQYTMDDVKKAGRLWDEMSLRDVAEETGISSSTLFRWSSMDLISTETNHNREVSPEKVERADHLCDHIPLREVAERVGVNYRTVREWRNKGWISIDKDLQGRGNGPEKKANPRKVVEMYFETEMSQREVGEKVGVARQTVSKYVKQYRNGNL